MIDFIVSFIFFVPVATLIWLLVNSYRKPKLQEDLQEEHADTDIVPIPYRGEYISMTWIEYLNGWQSMNRDQKNFVFKNQMEKLKKGIVTKRFINDTEYVIEATKRSQKQLNNQNKLNEIYKTGV